MNKIATAFLMLTLAIAILYAIMFTTVNNQNAIVNQQEITTKLQVDVISQTFYNTQDIEQLKQMIDYNETLGIRNQLQNQITELQKNLANTKQFQITQWIQPLSNETLDELSNKLDHIDFITGYTFRVNIDAGTFQLKLDTNNNLKIGLSPHCAIILQKDGNIQCFDSYNQISCDANYDFCSEVR